MANNSRAGLVLGLVGGVATVGGLLAWAAFSRADSPLSPGSSSPLPSGLQTFSGSYTEADVEAAARMLASENPRKSKQLHIEQVFSQLRARRLGDSLFDRITAGSGWGKQGDRNRPGGVRPVSTDKPANDAQRSLAREILDGMHTPGF